jgi:hypothetical protein
MRSPLAIAACTAAAVAAAAGAGPAAPAATAAAPKVTVMVVGKERVLRDARALRARQRRVKVGSRRCAVAAGTPLAALAALRVPVRVRDYGACGRRPRDASGLFVNRIGSERNRGQDGWVYKVGRRAGSGGAADVAGPFGTGRRLRGGDRLLWFWCEMQSSGCQRTLEAVPDRGAAARGETVRVTVRGYDDQGRGVAVSGATVRLGTASALTGADGVATVTVAEAGRLALTASAPGMVRSFPGEVRAG